jgi:hypothetical protein
VALIDAPLLDSIYISFFDKLIPNTPQLAQFMRRTTRLQAHNEAHVNFDYSIHVGYLPQTRTFEKRSGMSILYEEVHRQPSNLVRIFTSVFPSIYMVENLYIYENPQVPPQLQDDLGNILWLGMFHPFSAVKNLYVSKEFAPRIKSNPKELLARKIEVFPDLQKFFLRGSSH